MRVFLVTAYEFCNDLENATFVFASFKSAQEFSETILKTYDIDHDKVSKTKEIYSSNNELIGINYSIEWKYEKQVGTNTIIKIEPKKLID